MENKTLLDYQHILSWMFSRLPNFQRVGAPAYKPNLDRMWAFMRYLGNPQNKIKTIHIAGTNGKGSVSHMIASVLQEAKYKVGLYTSPHLLDFSERIKLNGVPVSKAFIVHFINSHKKYIEEKELSFFEMTVGMAYSFFYESKVDVAVIEVGLGGRLDGTNVITPLATVITSISYDHTQFLGDTLEQIATEKAGILKEKVPIIIGEDNPRLKQTFEKIAKVKSAPISWVNHFSPMAYETDLKGAYQQRNLATAVTLLKKVECLTLTEESIRKGLVNVVKNTKLYGRWQEINKKPKTILDMAHNSAGIKSVFQQIEQEQFDKLHIVLGMVKDKKTKSIVSLLPKNATYYLCTPSIERGLEVKILSKIFETYKLSHLNFKEVTSALAYANEQAMSNDFILVIGSTFIIADLLKNSRQI